MISALAIGLLSAVIYLVITRHRHRWTAWSSPVDQSTGYPIQSKRCKDAACNLYKIRRVNP